MQVEKNILISTSNKTGIDKFKQLVEIGWNVISTGGTAKYLKALSIPCQEVSEITKFPEMMDGRLKTLHPMIEGPILVKRNDSGQMIEAKNQGMILIDIVVVNLYPFEQDPCIEQIDIGGPTMLRAAAKNYESVAAVVDPADYDLVIQEVLKNGTVSDKTRQMLAGKVFIHTTHYENAIAEWFKRLDEKQELVRGLADMETEGAVIRRVLGDSCDL